MPNSRIPVEWLRDTQNIHVAASSFPVSSGLYGYQMAEGRLAGGYTPASDSYYGALSIAITEALKISKKAH